MNTAGKYIVAAAALLASSLAGGAAYAATSVITFDEYAAANANGVLPSNRYAALGVTFLSADDGSTWAGTAAGDPGGWGVNGTNGTNFQGFNGSSYSETLTFSSLISLFEVDATRTGGSSDGTVTINAFLNGAAAGTTSATLGAINSWSTLSLAGNFNSLQISGFGTSFHPFALDNMRFTTATPAVPEPATWAMMILGMGAVGFAMRRRNKDVSTSFRFA